MWSGVVGLRIVILWARVAWGATVFLLPLMAAPLQVDMPYATQRQKRILLILQDFRCALCDLEITGRFECDHVVPLSRGGGSSTAELQALCITCHKQKTKLDGSRHRQFS
jgi:hypothetical protein